jgi:hypothetical protein
MVPDADRTSPTKTKPPDARETKLPDARETKPTDARDPPRTNLDRQKRTPPWAIKPTKTVELTKVRLNLAALASLAHGRLRARSLPPWQLEKNDLLAPGSGLGPGKAAPRW